MTANRLWPIRFEHRIPLAGKMRFDSVLFRERDGQGKGRIGARKSGDSGNAIIETAETSPHTLVQRTLGLTQGVNPSAF
jgi:hypothetical protein